jgi:hypothetical protein
MTQPSVTFSESELDSALAVIEGYGASDFFPEPFEFAAMRHSWDKVRPVLAHVDMLAYT